MKTGMPAPIAGELSLFLAVDRAAGHGPMQAGDAAVRVDVVDRVVVLTLDPQDDVLAVITLTPAPAHQLGERLISAARACSQANGITAPDAGPAEPKPRGRTAADT